MKKICFYLMFGFLLSVSAAAQTGNGNVTQNSNAAPSIEIPEFLNERDGVERDAVWKVSGLNESQLQNVTELLKEVNGIVGVNAKAASQGVYFLNIKYTRLNSKYIFPALLKGGVINCIYNGSNYNIQQRLAEKTAENEKTKTQNTSEN